MSDLFATGATTEVAPGPAACTSAILGPRPWPNLLHGYFQLRCSHYEALLEAKNQIVVDDMLARRLYREIFATASQMVILTESPMGLLHALTTPLGLRTARSWFQEKPYRIYPQSTLSPTLLRNYNHFVIEETEWQRATMAQFFEQCQDPTFKRLWAPKLTVPVVPTYQQRNTADENRKG